MVFSRNVEIQFPGRLKARLEKAYFALQYFASVGDHLLIICISRRQQECDMQPSLVHTVYVLEGARICLQGFEGGFSPLTRSNNM